MFVFFSQVQECELPERTQPERNAARKNQACSHWSHQVVKIFYEFNIRFSFQAVFFVEKNDWYLFCLLFIYHCGFINFN